MDEYIKREEAIEAVKHAWAKGLEPSQYLEIIPASDVAPVRHGEWILGKDLPYGWGQILKNKYHLYCSECLEQAFNRSEDNDSDFDVYTTYCPFCGCCMDGGAV